MSDFTFHLPIGFPPGHFPTTFPTLGASPHEASRRIQLHRPVFVLKGGRASSLRLAYLLERQNFGYLCRLVTDQRLPSGSMSPHVPLANWLSARTLPNNFSNAWRQSARGIPAHPITQTCVRSEGRSGFQLAARVLVRETELRVLVPPSHRSAATLRLDVPTRSTCQLAFHPDTSQQNIPSFGPCTTTTWDHRIRLAY